MFQTRTKSCLSCTLNLATGYICTQSHVYNVLILDPGSWFWSWKTRLLVNDVQRFAFVSYALNVLCRYTTSGSWVRYFESRHLSGLGLCQHDPQDPGAGSGRCITCQYLHEKTQTSRSMVLAAEKDVACHNRPKSEASQTRGMGLRGSVKIWGVLLVRLASRCRHLRRPSSESTSKHLSQR